MAYALRGIARAGLSKQDAVEALSIGGMIAELLTWDPRGGNKPRGSTGGRPWFGVCNGVHLALAICGAIGTRQHSAVGGGAPGPSANVRGASRFRARVSPVPVQCMLLTGVP